VSELVSARGLHAARVIDKPRATQSRGECAKGYRTIPSLFQRPFATFSCLVLHVPCSGARHPRHAIGFALRQSSDTAPVACCTFGGMNRGREGVIRVSSIRKLYGKVVGVDDVSFDVRDGEIFGLIGPNGAGKTTTMECVEGIRRPDAGSITVLGLDPIRDTYALQERIGVQLQQAQLQKRIKVWEAAHLWSSLYRKPSSLADELLEQLGLTEKRNAWFMTLSGGQKQRLFIALALINDPEVVFLDELTTGLDPQARRKIWDLVRGIRERGKTVFLTTHLMEEAERLCDRVAIIDRGRIVDIDHPQRLVDKYCPERSVILATSDPRAADALSRIPGVESVTARDSRLTIRGSGDRLVTDVIGCLSETHIAVSDFRTEMPNLEDVFLKVTGRSLRD
jgi:ABC-2 type transport system ATP-binding protein